MSERAPLLPDTVLFCQNFWRDSARYPASFCLSRCRASVLVGARDRFLSPTEEALWRGFRFQRRRESHLLGRYCAKEAIACQGALPSHTAFQIEAGVFQQPIVRGHGADGLQVSITHSEHWGAAVAFDPSHPMGIDMERIRPDRRSAIESQMTPREIGLVRAASGDEDSALAVMWTVKEALSKTLRTGLMTPFSIFEIAAPAWDSQTLACEFVSFGQYRALGFLVADFALGIVFPKRSELDVRPVDFRARFIPPAFHHETSETVT